jgi:hypothetical protein
MSSLIYDPRDHTWDSWCALTAEQFAQQQLGIVPEEHWKDWASGVQGIGFFVNSGVPDPRIFDDWREWAKAFVGAMTIK